jgi:ferrous iron transport protein B
MRLSELHTGEKGVIVKVQGHGGFRKRIVEMGFIKGKTVEVILNAPLKDPIKYRILGYEISLRREEAAHIEVVSEEEARQELHPEAQPGIPSTEEIPEAEWTAVAQGKRKTINVALVGNPNCGKTSMFNIASGMHERVGNYSGVTVDAKEGHFGFKGYNIRLIDLPGTYSLSAYSPEEIYVREYIIDQTPDVIINVVDSSNIERNLYLTTQLIDMNVRMVIALNMYDELEQSGNKLDYVNLSRLLGVPMVPTVCRRQQGIEQLFDQVINVYENADALDTYFALQMQPHMQRIVEHVQRHEQSRKGTENEEEEVREKRINEHIQYHEKKYKQSITSHLEQQMSDRPIRHIHINHRPELEAAINQVQAPIQVNSNIRHKYSTRFLAIKLLENDKVLEEVVRALPNGKEILQVRDKAKQRIFQVTNEDSESAIADAKYGFIQGALKETYTDNHLPTGQVTKVIDSFVTHRIWGYPIFFLFLFIIFEGTFVLGDYPMQGIEWLVDQIGTLVQEHMPEGTLKDMIVDGIIGGVGGVIVFLPNILLLYFFISIMEDSGYMARAAFIMDKIMHKMGLHGKSFIPLIMGFGCNVPAIMASRTIENRKSRLITMLITPLMSCSARLPIYLVLIGALFPNNASLILLSIYAIGIFLAVILARLFSKVLVKGDDTPFVMELPPYRMPTAKAILRHTWEKGEQYLRKMGGIIMIASIIIWFLGYYPNHNAYTNQTEQQENSYIGQIGKAIEPVIEPLGFDWKLGIGLISGAGAKELVVSTLGVLYTNNDDVESVNLSQRIPITPLVAYAYMLFVLIYFPCIATMAAIRQVSGSWKWAIFTACYTTGLAWLVSFLFYQIGSLFV